VVKVIPLYGSCDALSMGKKTPKIVPFPCDCTTPPEGNRAVAIATCTKQSVKIASGGSGDMIANRQTNTQTRSLQYFATAPAGEVIRVWNNILITQKEHLSTRSAAVIDHVCTTYGGIDVKRLLSFFRLQLILPSESRLTSMRASALSHFQSHTGTSLVCRSVILKKTEQFLLDFRKPPRAASK